MGKELEYDELLGVDAGSISIKMIWKQNGHSRYLRQEHYGDPLQTFGQMLQELPSHRGKHRSLITGKYADILSRHYHIPSVSAISCLVNTLNKDMQTDIRYIVDIGSSGLSVVEIQDNKFQGYETNSMCAAGTGAFLDQQMKRMGLDYEQIRNIPLIENPPAIASRCAVFAKSDLIHRQQQGYSIQQLWNGLVKGLAASAYATLFRGKTIQHDVLLIGGMANNDLFRHYFSRLLNNRQLLQAPQPDFFLADSLIRYLIHHPGGNGFNGKENNTHQVSFEKPLSFKVDKPAPPLHYIDAHSNEVDIWKLEKGQHYQVFAGVDVGSTSTKMALLDEQGTVLAGLYTRTMGKPIDALRTLLEGLVSLQQQHDVLFSIRALGTTGSGRNLAGNFAGADLVRNEITAHLKGAIKEHPDVKTIFEIGGQDSKYIQVEDSWMKDANMNYVCAAGTGSFLEEQAKALNIALDDIPAVCRDAMPPISSDRCTVFMEQDGNQLLARGFTRNQVMSSVLYSVCKNYLNRVVHNRPVQEPILFLGATAKNQGLVEAFENVLGKKIHTSVYSHLMGAIGIAEMLRKDPPLKTSFRGLELRHQPVSLREEPCTLCRNHCRITHMQVGDSPETTSWGYMCGKEPDDQWAKPSQGLQAVNHLARVINKREKPAEAARTIYFPRGLQYFSYNPFWQHFFKELNISLIPTRPSDEEILDCARSYALTDFCFPLKLATGHVMHSVNRQQLPLFIPYHIQDTANPKADNSYFCPLSQAFASIMKSTLGYNDLPEEQLLSPVIDFSKDAQYNIRQLQQSLAPAFGIDPQQISQAWELAVEKDREMRLSLRTYGQELLQEIGSDSKPSFVILGRGYNILDNTLNLGILSSIARYGYRVIPMDVLPLSREDMPEAYHDMYWSYGQKIIVAARCIASHKNLYPVFLTNFSCGPDSFLLSTFEQIMGHKPNLILELDEHGGDAGYLTRLEAYFDRVEHHFRQTVAPLPHPEGQSRIEPSLSKYRMYIPPMHPFGSRLLSATLRAYGIDAVALTREDSHTFALGKEHVRGSECMPAASTIGAFLHQLNQEDKHEAPLALFMPCTSGPCRFGQYARLHDQILQKLGIDARIISPNSDNDYQDISGKLRMRLLAALTLSDVLLKLGCRIRPYEKQKGQTDELMAKTMTLLEKAMEARQSIIPLLKDLNHKLNAIPLREEKRPLVGVVGEIYVRNSPFSNAYLIRHIEASGGEAWMAPMMEWLHYTNFNKKCSRPADYISKWISQGFTHYYEKRYMGIFSHWLRQRHEPPIAEVVRAGKQHLPPQVEGEAILTIGRAIGFINQEAALVVNVAPFGCMPGSISTAVLKNVSKKYNTPVVSVFYDGETDFSDLVQTYIANSR